VKKITLLFVAVCLFSSGQAQGLFINEFCSLNSTLPDEDRDSPDWLELYNTNDADINLSGWALSDDSTELKKWIFPTTTLPAHQALLLFASAKDRKEMVFYKNIIQQGDTFTYAIGSSAIPSNWNSLGYDDNNWDKGPSGFGYGDSDDATTVPNGTLSVFVRKKFTVSQAVDVKEMLLHVDYDDGFVAYINGTEVARTNLGTGNTMVPYNQTADNYVEPLMVKGQTPMKFDITNFSGLLVDGSNVLCMQVHNNTTTSSDLTLIPFLTLGFNSSVGSSTEIPEVLQLNNKLYHTNFKIGADGERIFLVTPLGVIADRTDSIALPPGVSYGRFPDGQNNWFYFGEPTPGALNTTQTYDTLSDESVTFSVPGGVYSSGFSLVLKTSGSGDIYYTTDGSIPNENSIKYSTAISINTSQVIRAIATGEYHFSLKPAIQTYVIESRNIKLPVVSLTTDPYNLWDYNYGIYVLGPKAESELPYFNANFWMDWERPVYFEYTDQSGKKVFESNAGTKIFGAWSRANDQKSMALFARKAYGNSSFKYPFFKERENDNYKSLVLRNAGNDWASTAMRDAALTGLLTELDIDRQAYQPVAVYLNGTYWGILNLREKVNENFIADLHPSVDADKIDFLQVNNEVIEGSADHYRKMLNYLASNSVAKNEVYDSIQRLMEVVNFMDYEISEIYFNNTDWPGNNIKYWRPQTQTGRWRWIIYDTDFGFGIWNVSDYAVNTLTYALEPNGPDWPNPPWGTYLLRTLLTNNSFKSEFINRFADRLNYDFEPTRVKHIIDSLKSNIADEMPYHIARWNHIPNFNANLNNMKTFATYRPNYLRGFINERFALDGTVYLTVDVSDVTRGYIQVSSLRIRDGFPWTGKYFKSNPVRVTAISNPGYEFSHWEGIDSVKPSILLNIPLSGLNLKAVFQKSVKEYNSIVINEINYKSPEDHDCGDWVELFNSTSGPVDLSGWVFKDADDTHKFVITSGTVIQANQYLVLYESEDKFRAFYPGLTSAMGQFGFGLSETEDVVRLFDSSDQLIDSLYFMNDDSWPKIGDNEGSTLSLIDPYKNNERYYWWETSENYGTPGRQNDNYNDIKYSKPELNLSASVYPNPFNRQAIIRWRVTKPTHVIISVYDFKGMQIQLLQEGTYPPGTFETVWNAGEQTVPGLYFVQICDEEGQTTMLKLVKQ